jgi:galactofuranosylgalactofuranosylrhamnosyl-N-acetylglucosaminyl-diphospho-decaprenol beta-1,5/1,6-galactofuranosyltransferase
VLATLPPSRPAGRLAGCDRGQPGPGRLASHPASRRCRHFARRLRIFEQGNFGGCGGFTRGLLEARAIPAQPHAVLMDDDVARSRRHYDARAASLPRAQPRRTLGGHMLDMLRPTRSTRLAAW